MKAITVEAADPAWLAGFLARRVPLAHWRDKFQRRDGDINVVVLFEPDAT